MGSRTDVLQPPILSSDRIGGTGAVQYMQNCTIIFCGVARVLDVSLESQLQNLFDDRCSVQQLFINYKKQKLQIDMCRI